MSTAYNGNELIKDVNVKFAWTAKKIEEFEKCQADPIYFITKYIQVFTVDYGIQPFALWDFQKEMVEMVDSNRYSAIRCARQAGKCLESKTYVTLRNKKTGEIRKTPIGEFYKESINVNPNA